MDRLSVLVLSHPDINHIGGALDVVRSMPVGEVWCPRFKGRSTTYDDLMDELERRRIPVRRLCAGDKGALAGRATWDVFHPQEDGAYTRGDDASLVLRVGRGEVAVLFMGGAGGRVEREISTLAAEPSATILIPGVQKSHSFCTESWLNLVEPQLVVLGASAFSQNRASERRLRDRLESLDIDLWDIGWSGPVRVEWGGGKKTAGTTKPFRTIPLAR